MALWERRHLHRRRVDSDQRVRRARQPGSTDRLRRRAATAAQALDDATQPDIGYPGLTYPDDVAEVLDALASLASGLQSTVAHLGRFLDEQLDAGRLTGTSDSTGAAAVSATRARLQEAYASTGELATQLARAATAVTDLSAAAR